MNDEHDHNPPAPIEDEGGLRAPPGLTGWRKAWWWFDFIILVKLARLRFIAVLVLIETTDLTPEDTADIWDGLVHLVGEYLSPAKGYASRRAVFGAAFPGDYDHLARFGEWEIDRKSVV